MRFTKLYNILKNVEKPGRYTGGEWKSIKKNEAKLRFALCFPDVYEIGMSHLGSRILYNVINSRDEYYCERAYAPWPDMEKAMRDEGIKLFSLETKRPLDTFDIVGFSLLYEMCYTNILTMLELSNIPLISEERGENEPLIICGGPCACNTEPLYKIIDVALIGDGEELVLQVMDMVLEAKEKKLSKKELLIDLSSLQGVYVPSFYESSYDDKGVFVSLNKKENKAPESITRAVVKDLDKVPYVGEPIVPNLSIVHDRVALELFRGCTRGCRFCQAGYIYRPVRERKKETLIALAKDLIDCTGYDELSLFSLSSSDYSKIHELIPSLMDSFKEKKVSLSLPSLRIDKFLKDDLMRMQEVRKSGLTFAPEAGTQRLRDVINKGVTQEHLLRVAKESFEAGWTSLKLYFMIGLPTETDEDVLGIAALAKRVQSLFYSLPKEMRRKSLRLGVSVSSFVPKPFTPFQWVAQDTVEELKRKQMLLANALKGMKGVEFKYHDTTISKLEAAFSRGDRRLCDVLILAYKSGCRFDSWAEHLRPDLWEKAFLNCNVSIDDYANRERDINEPLPWDHIDMLVTKDYFKKEYLKSKNEITTQDCRNGCNACFKEENANLCRIS